MTTLLPWPFLVCLLALSVIQATSAPFPIGIYSVPSASDFAELRAAGFNLVVGNVEKSYLDAARAADLKVLAYPPSAQTSQREREHKKLLRSLDSHPALWGWYLVDEPDLNLIPPDEVRARNQQLKRWKLQKPIVLTLFQGYEAPHYSEFCDILMVDRYPVSWLPLANFGEHVRMARLSLGKQKPLIAIIQAFDWTAYPGMLRTKAPLRPPTYAEIRCMAYEALARGANGIFFFEFDGPWKVRAHPEVWEALKAVVREINDREPLFKAQARWWAKDHDYADPDTAFNEALSSSVTSTLLMVSEQSEEVVPGAYILAVNNTPKPLKYSFLIPPNSTSTGLSAPNGMVPVLGESRTLTPSARRVEDHFSPFEVHVYGPLDRVPTETSPRR